VESPEGAEAAQAEAQTEAETDVQESSAETRMAQTRGAILEPKRVFDAEALSRALDRLADNGWNSVALPGFLDGYSIFPSAAWAEYGLRRQHPRFRKWNPLEVAFDVAWRRNLDILLVIQPYQIEWHAGRRPPILRRYPKWAAMGHPSRKHRATPARPAQIYYCPVNRGLRRFLSDTLYALAEDYPFHGLLIDLRHYPFYSGGEGKFVPYCYCETCREATLHDLGFDPASVDFAKEDTLVERWKEWQARQMDEAMAYIRTRALKARATMRILGLLSTDAGLTENILKPLIHWKTWVERSLVEALVLDRYSPDAPRFEAQLKADLETLPKNSLLLPMLPRTVRDDQAFLRIFERYAIPGFTTRFEEWDQEDFDPARRVSFDMPAFSVESDPIHSICALFEKMSKAAYFEKDFAAFLADLGRALCRGAMPLTLERVLMVAENVRGLYELVAKKELDLGARSDQMLHDLDLAARLAYLAGCDLSS